MQPCFPHEAGQRHGVVWDVLRGVPRGHHVRWVGLAGDRRPAGEDLFEDLLHVDGLEQRRRIVAADHLARCTN